MNRQKIEDRAPEDNISGLKTASLKRINKEWSNMKSSITNIPPHLLDPVKLQSPVIGITFHDSRSGHGSKVASNLSFLCVSRLLNNTHTLERRGGGRERY